MTTAAQKATVLRGALQGKPLHPNAAIAQEYERAILTLIRRLHDDARREMARVFGQSTFHAQALAQDDRNNDTPLMPGQQTGAWRPPMPPDPASANQYAGATGAASAGQSVTTYTGGSGTVAAQARIALNALLAKYEPMFSAIGRKATARMIARTIRNSHVTAGMSLREIARDFTLKPTVSARMREIITASTQEAAGLITRIGPEYLGQIQGAVMRSIVGGGGLDELVPLLGKLYGQRIRWARMVAMDQTRKVYNSLTARRLQDAGVKQFKWLHIGGSTHPRKQHIEWSGQIFDYDDLPVDDTFGPVLPGQAINCRCSQIPVIKLNQD
jgi:SPP1 gp7 family putative phage head morphogenesis protein